MPDYGNIPFRYTPSNLAAIPYSPDWFKAQGWQQTTTPIDLSQWGGTGQIAAGMWFDPAKQSPASTPVAPNASNVPASEQAWMARFGVHLGGNQTPSLSPPKSMPMPQATQTAPPLTGSPFQIMQQAQAATTPQLPQFPNYSGFQFNQQQAQRPFRGTGGPRQPSSYFQA